MKKFTLLTLFSLFGILVFSQKPSRSSSQILSKEIIGRNCGTMLHVEALFKKNPQLKIYGDQLARTVPPGPVINNYRTTSIVTIPVVVHIVLPNPDLVTDADVQWQINKLNLDYSGLNPDSTNEPAAFLALRGHSQIRFALARRTPGGILTTGIERITSGVGSDASATVDPIKRAAQGGADVWDPNSYLNLWVGVDGSGQGILGYAHFPASGDPLDDGVFINFQSWGNNPCYTLSAFNLGRTAVHEVGHYFGLLHNWGDDGSACTGDDFASLSTVGSSCNLPAGLFNPTGQGNTASDIGDTPNQAGSNSGLCPSGIKTDACTNTAPGIMYQDFMDYTNDACYSMFTEKQVERMEWVLDNCRASLKTSLAAIIPSGAVTLDASAFQSVNPGGSELVGCSSVVSYPSVIPCPGSIVPKIRIRNNGLNTLNTITVGLIINGGAPVTQNISVNLPFGYTTVVSFPSVNFTTGTYTLQYYTKNPNGTNPDQVPSNDTLTTTFTVASPVAIPITQGFETTPFPPSGWSIFNPDNDNTWVRVTPGHNSNFSAAIDNYNSNVPGEIDDIRTPKLTFPAADSVLIIAFDVAHKNYPDASNYDTLSVLVSNDCGATFTTVYKKSGPALASDTSSFAYITPAQGDWRTEKITLRGSILSTGNIIVAFRNTNEFGNNIFLDNINIAPPSPGDAKLLSIDLPSSIICSTTVTPSVTIQNAGAEALASFNVSYSVDNGAVSTTNFTGLNLGSGQLLSEAINPSFNVTTTGVHTIKVFVSGVLTTSGAADINLLNDTLTKTFTLVGRISTPLTEGFESSTFPPINWAVDNPDGSITWERTTAAAKTGVASMVIRNYDYTAFNTIDRFASPVITGIGAYDSLFVSFDLAYNLRNGASMGSLDTLELQVTHDCGQTFTTVWKKWGSDLQTTAVISGAAFIPSSTDWKNIRVYLSPYINSPSFQLYFVAKSNHQNDLYIDNINVFGITLPQRLKNQGYEIYPNPFNSTLQIHHYLLPTSLQVVTVYNSMGQKVWEQQYNGNAGAQINVDLTNVMRGVYFVNLTYRDHVVIEKVIKN